MVINKTTYIFLIFNCGNFVLPHKCICMLIVLRYLDHLLITLSDLVDFRPI